jgi:hypothetical protein
MSARTMNRHDVAEVILGIGFVVQFSAVFLPSSRRVGPGLDFGPRRRDAWRSGAGSPSLGSAENLDEYWALCAW